MSTFPKHITISEGAWSRPDYQAYQLMHLGYTLAPIIAGADKFFHSLVRWDMYLAPSIIRMVPISISNLMMAIGVVEIAAGLLVAFKPRWGGYVVAAWLLGIIINLLMAGGFYDIALRDFGLMLGALALARLSVEFDHA